VDQTLRDGPKPGDLVETAQRPPVFPQLRAVKTMSKYPLELASSDRAAGGPFSPQRLGAVAEESIMSVDCCCCSGTQHAVRTAGLLGRDRPTMESRVGPSQAGVARTVLMDMMPAPPRAAPLGEGGAAAGWVWLGIETPDA